MRAPRLIAQRDGTPLLARELSSRHYSGGERTFNGRVVDLDELIAHEAHGQRGLADTSSYMW